MIVYKSAPIYNTQIQVILFLPQLYLSLVSHFWHIWLLGLLLIAILLRCAHAQFCVCRIQSTVMPHPHPLCPGASSGASAG